jgi:hypothetical protein
MLDGQKLGPASTNLLIPYTNPATNTAKITIVAHLYQIPAFSSRMLIVLLRLAIDVSSI